MGFGPLASAGCDASADGQGGTGTAAVSVVTQDAFAVVAIVHPADIGLSVVSPCIDSSPSVSIAVPATVTDPFARLPESTKPDDTGNLRKPEAGYFLEVFAGAGGLTAAVLRQC